jgi:TRAP-type C4-dicarboxylate transport system permease small subunit
MIEKMLLTFEKFCRIAAVLSLGAMFLINILNIGFRALFNYSFVWVFPLTLFLFIWMTFFGAFVIYRQKREITVDFIYSLLPEIGRVWITIICNILMMALLILFLWTAPRLIRSQASLMQVLQIPRYLQAIPLFLFCIGTLLNFLKDTALLIRNKGIPPTVHG